MGQDSNDSEELLRRAAAGDEAALGTLSQCHRARLRQMVRLRLDRRLLGRVATPTSCRTPISTWPPASPTTPASGPLLWLRLVTGQRLAQTLRRYLGAAMRDAGREVSLYRGALPQASSASLAAQLLGPFTTASQAAVRAERQIQLQEALNGREAMDHEILALRHFEGLSNGELAEVLSLSKSAANNRYIRALGRLRDLLEHVPGFFEGG
jgi:RNA polymerase sigma-70 factor (ECF subfamily)